MAGCGSAASAVVQPWAVPVQLSGGALAALVAIVLVGTLGAYMLYLQGVADAGPVKASLLCCVEPVSAMVLALFWLHTPVSVWDLAGCGLDGVAVVSALFAREDTAQAARQMRALAEQIAR